MTSVRYYTIDEAHVVHGPYRFEGWIEWAARMENQLSFEAVCRVGRTQVDGDCWISTCFLRGIDHSMYWLNPGATPLLFETMVFGGDFSGHQWRYSTWDEAAAGHQFALDVVMGRRQLVEPEDLDETQKGPGARRLGDDAAGAA